MSSIKSLYVCEAIPGKGRGLVAATNILAGTRILAESPLITLPRGTNNKDSSRKNIITQLSALPQDQQQAYLSLSNAHGKEDGEELGIARTNAFPLGSNAREGAVFLEASRINHACNPNAQNTWNESIQKLTIYAARDIQQGEEITVQYLAQVSKRSVRLSKLKETFRFTCRCDLCSVDEERRIVSDRQLEEIQRLEDRIGDGVAILHQPLSVLHDVRKMLALIRDEGCSSASEASAYYDGFQVAVMHSDLARARELAKRSSIARAVVEGLDSPQVKRLDGLAANPSNHASFGLTRNWKTAVESSPKDVSEEEFENWLWRMSTNQPRQLADFQNEGMFPSFDDLPSDDDIDLEFYSAAEGLRYTPSKHWCFLAEITDMDNFTRLNLALKDRAGQTTRLMFYTDSRGQEVPPSLLRKGYTIAVLYAEQHGFLDSSVGIRHEDPRFLKILPISLEKLLKLSDRVQSHSSTSDNGITCHTCGQNPNTLRKCARCSLFWYCNKDCQTTGWVEKGHKEDCKLLRDSDLQGLFRLDWGNFHDHHTFN